MTELKKASGSCLCGQVTFEFDFPSLWCAHCYCSMCQKAHGAGFVTWIGVAEAQFRVTGGAGRITRYASSRGAMREFCGNCGASMFFRSSRWPGEVHIALACLDSGADRAPERNVFTDKKAPWIALASLETHGQ